MLLSQESADVISKKLEVVETYFHTLNRRIDDLQKLLQHSLEAVERVENSLQQSQKYLDMRGRELADLKISLGFLAAPSVNYAGELEVDLNTAAPALKDLDILAIDSIASTSANAMVSDHPEGMGSKSLPADEAINDSDAVNIDLSVAAPVGTVIFDSPPASGQPVQFLSRRPLRRHSDSTTLTMHSITPSHARRRYSEGGRVCWVPPADLCWRMRQAETAIDDDNMDCDD